ncbi:MAG: helix-turn-helix transcriptional regulator [Clostridia bacterium]|nr:helix-turn-helix transcriptional regulator [Clostridia bacterium]
MYENLLALMAQKGISIDAMAKLLNVHRNTVSLKLNGESEFTFGQAELIMDTMFPEYNFKFVFRRKEPA